MATLSLVIFQSFLYLKKFLYGYSAQNVDHQEQSLLRADLLLPGCILQESSRFTPVRLGKTVPTSVCFSVSSRYESVPQSQIMKGHGAEPWSSQRKGVVTLVGFIPWMPLSGVPLSSYTTTLCLSHPVTHSCDSSWPCFEAQHGILTQRLPICSVGSQSSFLES